MKKGDKYYIKSKEHRIVRDSDIIDIIIIGDLMMDDKYACYSTHPDMKGAPLFYTKKQIKQRYYSEKELRKLKIKEIEGRR